MNRLLKQGFGWSPELRLTRWLFLKALAMVYLCAFVSLGTQVEGLLGSKGISPVPKLAELALSKLGTEAYFQFPSWLWLAPNDNGLLTLCGVGVVVSLLLLAGIAPVLCLAILWSAYLSVVSFGAPFFQFQWDMLLLETGFLAIFLAPLVWRTGWPVDDPPVSVLTTWLVRLLLFRLMLSSGIVKLAAGGPSWSALTAMDYHYWTQPLPLPTSYYAALLPHWFHAVETVLVLVSELVVPWFVLFGPRARKMAFSTFVALMGLILATGNYGFFNWLTLALCLMLAQDDWWPGRFRPQATASKKGRWPRPVLGGLALGLLLLSVSPWFGAARLQAPKPLRELSTLVAPLRLVNSYGLFAVMTTSRPEVELQGSLDGREWKPFVFPYKMGPVERRPAFAGPHMPRLDWQMWFAALGTPQRNPWLYSLCQHLLQGTPEVLELLETDPFSEKRPTYIRAVLYQYEFTRAGEKWWVRTEKGVYLGPLSLKS